MYGYEDSCGSFMFVNFYGDLWDICEYMIYGILWIFMGEFPHLHACLMVIFIRFAVRFAMAQNSTVPRSPRPLWPRPRDPSDSAPSWHR
jgi:hypothetical protein